MTSLPIWRLSWSLMLESCLFLQPYHVPHLGDLVYLLCSKSCPLTLCSLSPWFFSMRNNIFHTNPSSSAFGVPLFYFGRCQIISKGSCLKHSRFKVFFYPERRDALLIFYFCPLTSKKVCPWLRITWFQHWRQCVYERKQTFWSISLAFLHDLLCTKRRQAVHKKRLTTHKKNRF